MINFWQKQKNIFVSIDNKNKIDIHLDDSRNLSSFIPKKSVDYVFTSPPYFNALDYTAILCEIRHANTWNR